MRAGLSGLRERGRSEWSKRTGVNILRAGIVLLFLGLAVWAIILNHYDLVIGNSEPLLLLSDALMDVGPELAGIVIGVVTLDYLGERRQREQLKAQLIRQLGSRHNDIADPAARELAHYGWLYDGSLSGAYLYRVNLSESEAMEANFSGALMWGADLSGATLDGANLSEAALEGADLSRAILMEANLSNADLLEANMSGAILVGANLSGAVLHRTDMSGADLRRAWGWTLEQLQQAATLHGTVMPDGVRLAGSGMKTEGLTFEQWKAQYLARQWLANQAGSAQHKGKA